MGNLTVLPWSLLTWSSILYIITIIQLMTEKFLSAQASVLVVFIMLVLLVVYWSIGIGHGD